MITQQTPQMRLSSPVTHCLRSPLPPAQPSPRATWLPASASPAHAMRTRDPQSWSTGTHQVEHGPAAHSQRAAYTRQSCMLSLHTQIVVYLRPEEQVHLLMRRPRCAAGLDAGEPRFDKGRECGRRPELRGGTVRREAAQERQCRRAPPAALPPGVDGLAVAPVHMGAPART